jgi:sensor histidine kinase regulating citrate/malate metabolism
MPSLPLRWILLLAVGVVSVPWLALAAAALPTMSAYIAPEQRARAAAVANIVASATEEVIGLDIPLSEEPGMRTYLEQILSENADIGFIALCDLNGRIVHAAQSVLDHPKATALVAGTSIVVTEAAFSDYAFVTREMMRDGKNFGAVVVGRSFNVPQALALDLLLNLAMGLAMLVLFCL